MDNAQFHRKRELRVIASRYHVPVWFLPPYSPDYNPIEKLWANMFDISGFYIDVVHVISAVICPPPM